MLLGLVKTKATNDPAIMRKGWLKLYLVFACFNLQTAKSLQKEIHKNRIAELMVEFMVRVFFPPRCF